MAPFESEQQRKFLFSQKPEVAKKFVEHAKPKGLLLVKKKKLSAKAPKRRMVK